MEQKKFPHDAIYKAVFSEKSLVKSLLLDFVKLPFVEDFDFSTLELFPANYATPAFSRHENDLVWRVSLKGNDCIIFLMLEFQSRTEKWMAARINKYTSLLLNSLIAHGPADLHLDRGLPPILPIVIYNGAAKWRAAEKLRQLFMPMPAQLRAYQPEQKYFLLDIRHVKEKIVRAASGEASFFVRLERAKSSDEAHMVMGDILRTCAGPEYDRFLRLIHNFIMCSLERSSWNTDLEKPMSIEEFEVLYDNYPRFVTAERELGFKKGIEEGIEKGIERGIEKGRLAGIEEGIGKGIQKGRQEGIAEGRQEERSDIVRLQLKSLEGQIANRFGNAPQSWLEQLAAISDPVKIMELGIALYSVSSREEFEARLTEAGGRE